MPKTEALAHEGEQQSLNHHTIASRWGICCKLAHPPPTIPQRNLDTKQGTLQLQQWTSSRTLDRRTSFRHSQSNPIRSWLLSNGTEAFGRMPCSNENNSNPSYLMWLWLLTKLLLAKLLLWKWPGLLKSALRPWKVPVTYLNHVPWWQGPDTYSILAPNMATTTQLHNPGTKPSKPPRSPPTCPETQILRTHNECWDSGGTLGRQV